ncbi:MAG TPA: serine hydrolase domain-containing protein [Acidimicrobiales bacterium]|nr:serine hydrolase domain-containing protein [Acidimicrobiales bacterium]
MTELPRSTPTEVGVDARRILAFLDAVADTRTDLHSLMILRRGRVVAEGWWAPYRSDDIQLLYSLSKTFLATAVGIAIGEGRLDLDDLVADLIPDHLPDPVPEHLGLLRVRHLLAMASGHREETIFRVRAMDDPDLVRAYLSIPPDEPPGTVFAYNQGNPLTLSQIITTLTGERVVDYLRPRLFDPLGVERAEWTTAADGLDQGFSGLHVTTESIAKLGQLLLQGGRWGYEQLVPAGFVADARRTHVDNRRHSIAPDWREGYGFQMWMCRYGCQRGDGAYGQFAVLVPDADAVLVCTAQVIEMQEQLNLFWDHLVPAVRGEGGDPGADAELAVRLKQLSTEIIPVGGPAPDLPFELAPTAVEGPFLRNIELVRISPLAGGSVMEMRIDGRAHSFVVPAGGWVDGELPGLHSAFPEVSVTGGWTSPSEFHADVVSRRTPHRLEVRVTAGVEPQLAISWTTPPLRL